MRSVIVESNRADKRIRKLIQVYINVPERTILNFMALLVFVVTESGATARVLRINSRSAVRHLVRVPRHADLVGVALVTWPSSPRRCLQEASRRCRRRRRRRRRLRCRGYA